jgi:hypothetical protein
MATGYAQSRYESVVGTEVNTPTLSTKTLYTPVISKEFDPGVQPLERDDELRGLDEPVAVLSDMYAGTWSEETRAYPDSVGFRLKHILGSPTTTAGNGVITDPDAATVPTNAYRHVWTAPFGPSGDAPLTTQEIMAWHDQTFYVTAKGCGCESLALESPEQGGVMMRTGGPITYYSRVSNPGLTPSYESLATRPFFQRDLVIVTWLGGSAISTAFSVEIANSIEDLDDLSVGPTQHRRGLAKSQEAAPIRFTGSIDKRVIDPDDFDALMNATGFGTKTRWKSRSFITGSYPYQLWIECDNAQYIGGGPGALSNNRRIPGQFNWKATSDGVGASVTVTLVNNVTSYI